LTLETATKTHNRTIPLNPTNACSCHICVHACRHRPGWFLPDEIRAAAAFVGTEVKPFFDRFLVVDYYCEEDGDIFLLAPAVSHAIPGQEAPFDPRGRCVFLDPNDRCMIHEAKPYECGQSHHSGSRSASRETRSALVDVWKRPESQALIRELLGREPVSVETSDL
jgi:Fe-S-cluster containining protein